MGRNCRAVVLMVHSDVRIVTSLGLPFLLVCLDRIGRMGTVEGVVGGVRDSGSADIGA